MVYYFIIILQNIPLRKKEYKYTKKKNTITYMIGINNKQKKVLTAQIFLF